MINIYETDGGKLNRLMNFEDGCWVRITSDNDAEIEEVARFYDIDFNDMKAALDEEEKARVVSEDNYAMVIVDIPASELQNDMKFYTTIPLGIILTQGALITICSEDTRMLDRFVNTHIKFFSTKKRTRFLYQILYYAMLNYQEVLRQVDDRRLDIENRVSDGKETEDDLVILHNLESTLVYFETSLRAASIVIDRLRRFKQIPKYDEDEDLLEDVQIENRQAIEMASIYREIIDGTSEFMSHVINNKLNNTMKYLTSITIVMAIPTIISGLYGMNVNADGMPFAGIKAGFTIICIITLVVCLIILYILKRKKML